MWSEVRARTENSVALTQTKHQHESVWFIYCLVVLVCVYIAIRGLHFSVSFRLHSFTERLEASVYSLWVHCFIIFNQLLP